MDDWFKDLWKENKLLFFILIPLALLAFFRDILLELLVGSARKVAKEAKEDDTVLRSQEERLQKEAAQAREEAEDLAKEIGEPKKDEDWHKDFKGDN